MDMTRELKPGGVLKNSPSAITQLPHAQKSHVTCYASAIGMPLIDYRFNDTWATGDLCTVSSRRHCGKLEHSRTVFPFGTFLSTEHLNIESSQALFSNEWNHKRTRF